MKYANYIPACVQTLVENAIEMSTKQTHTCVCVTQPSAPYKKARSICQPVVWVCTRNVQFTYVIGRVYYCANIVYIKQPVSFWAACRKTIDEKNITYILYMTPCVLNNLCISIKYCLAHWLKPFATASKTASKTYITKWRQQQVCPI